MVIDGLVELLFNDVNLTAEKLCDSSMTYSVMETYPNQPIDSIDNEVVRVLDKDFFIHETYTGKLTLNECATNALVAIAYDAKVRYNYGVDDLKSYLFHSLMGDQIDEIMADDDCDLADEGH